MERPSWMPETHLNKLDVANMMVCVCYHCILRCSDPNAAPEDKALLPGLVAAMVEFLKLT